jgi:hypothetical protein
MTIIKAIGYLPLAFVLFYKRAKSQQPEAKS